MKYAAYITIIMLSVIAYGHSQEARKEEMNLYHRFTGYMFVVEVEYWGLIEAVEVKNSYLRTIVSNLFQYWAHTRYGTLEAYRQVDGAAKLAYSRLKQRGAFEGDNARVLKDPARWLDEHHGRLSKDNMPEEVVNNYKDIIPEFIQFLSEPESRQPNLNIRKLKE